MYPFNQFCDVFGKIAQRLLVICIAMARPRIAQGLILASLQSLRQQGSHLLQVDIGIRAF